MSHLFGLILFCLLRSRPHSPAQFSPRDGQIIARTLSFIEAGTGGTLEIGIAYAPDRPARCSQAESLQGGDRRCTRRRQGHAEGAPDPDRSAANRASGIAGIFVTGDLGPQLDEVARAAQRLHVPTISTEMACVRTAQCILGFSSQPTVEIVLNHDAANSAGVRFTQAFRMLVREL